MGSATPLELPDPTAVRHVAIVGTGVIGAGWAAVFAARHYNVTAFVRSQGSEDKFATFLERAWQKLLSRGLAVEPEGWKAVKVVRSLAECVGTADYIQESVVEDLVLKQAILSEIDRLARPNVIIGTSSSYIPLSLARAKTTRPARIATAHPTLPDVDSFVEVLGSSLEYTRWLSDFFGPSGVLMDVVTLQREFYGHAINALLAALSSTCLLLINGRVCSISDVNRSAVHLAKLIIASDGLSGAMVGLVGGGNEEATVALSVDITMGAPLGISAVVLGWLLPAWLARCVLFVIQAVCNMFFLRSMAIKRLVSRFVRWWLADVFSQWHHVEQTFEKRMLMRLTAIDRITE